MDVFEKNTIVTARIYVEHWTPRYTAALENMMAVCHDLIDLEFKFDIDVDAESKNRLANDLKTANLALMPLLEDGRRASKLPRLRLLGDVHPKLLDQIFENCVNLEFFRYFLLVIIRRAFDHVSVERSSSDARAIGKLQFRWRRWIGTNFEKQRRSDAVFRHSAKRERYGKKTDNECDLARFVRLLSECASDEYAGGIMGRSSSERLS